MNAADRKKDKTTPTSCTFAEAAASETEPNSDSRSKIALLYFCMSISFLKLCKFYL